MEQYEETNQNEHFAPSAPANRWLIVAVLGALAIAAVAFGYGYHQQATVQQLTARESADSAVLDQMHNQVASLTAKLADVTAAQKATAEAAAQQAQQSAKKPRTASNRGAASDKRYKQLQAQLADQQKQLDETRGQVAQNRAELADSLSSTRDELNGSIARTHEELVALEKRGERNYFEFDLAKSKQFEHVGPIMLSLRKADPKHKHYDLAMIVDDDRLDKKKVNLYEPVWLHTENESQPVQVVVNRIRKNAVHGYVSAPKFRPSDLAAGASARALVPGKSAEGAQSSQNGQQPEPPPPAGEQQRPVRHPEEPPQPQQPKHPLF